MSERESDEEFGAKLLLSSASPLNLTQLATEGGQPGIGYQQVEAFVREAMRDEKLKELVKRIRKEFPNGEFSVRPYYNLIRQDKFGRMNKMTESFFREVNKQAFNSKTFSTSAKQAIAERVAEFDPPTSKGKKRVLAGGPKSKAKKKMPTLKDMPEQNLPVVEAGDLGSTVGELKDRAKEYSRKSVKDITGALEEAKQKREVKSGKGAVKQPHIPAIQLASDSYTHNTSQQKQPPRDVPAIATTTNLFMPTDTGNTLFGDKPYSIPIIKVDDEKVGLQQTSKNPSVPFTMGQAPGTTAQIPLIEGSKPQVTVVDSVVTGTSSKNPGGKGDKVFGPTYVDEPEGTEQASKPEVGSEAWASGIVKQIAQGDEKTVMAHAPFFYRSMLLPDFHRALIQNRREGETVTDMYTRLYSVYARDMNEQQTADFLKLMQEFDKQAKSDFKVAEQKSGLAVPMDVDVKEPAIKQALQNLGNWIDKKIDVEQISAGIGGLIGIALGRPAGATGAAVSEGAGVFLGSYIGHQLKKLNKWVFDEVTNAIIAQGTTREDLKYSGPPTDQKAITYAQAPTNLSVTAARNIGALPGLTQADKDGDTLISAQQMGYLESDQMKKLPLVHAAQSDVAPWEPMITEEEEDEKMFSSFPDKSITFEQKVSDLPYGTDYSKLTRQQVEELKYDMPVVEHRGLSKAVTEVRHEQADLLPRLDAKDKPMLPYPEPPRAPALPGPRPKDKFPAEFYKAVEGWEAKPPVEVPRREGKIELKDFKEEKEGKGEEKKGGYPPPAEAKGVDYGHIGDVREMFRRAEAGARGRGAAERAAGFEHDDEEEEKRSEVGTEDGSEPSEGGGGRVFRRRPVDVRGYDIRGVPGGNQNIPLLRPSFPVGSSKLVEDINQNPTTVFLDRLIWQSMKNYQWETNQESDNLLYRSCLQEAHLRFSDNEKLDPTGEKAQYIHDTSQMENPVMTGFRTPLDLRENGKFRGMCTTQWDGNAIIEGDIPFHDVFLKSDAEIPENSPWKRFSCAQGTTIPDSSRLPGGKLSTWDSEKWEMFNSFITSTVQ